MNYLIDANGDIDSLMALCLIGTHDQTLKVDKRFAKEYGGELKAHQNVWNLWTFTNQLKRTMDVDENIGCTLIF